MNNVMIKELKKPKLKDPILIEGLPGVGNVGKIAIEYLLDQLKAEKFAEIYSKYFPPQILINDDGTVYLVKNELYYKKTNKKNDIIFLIGDYQGLSNEGQFELSYEILNYVKKYNVKLLYTLGGYGMGQLVEDPRTFGAATNIALVEKFKKYNMIFSEGEPSNGIVGAAGLLLGIGFNFFNMNGVCLMGETSGYFSDSKSAKKILEILVKDLKLKIDFAGLDKRINMMNELTSKFQQQIEAKSEKKEDLNYIG